jgi:phage terminase large subunit-like protein
MQRENVCEAFLRKACRVEDGFLTPIKVWNPKRYPNEEIPRDDVDATVRACFEQFDVVAFRADVKEFENYVDTWGRDFRRQLKINASRGHPVAFDMRGQKKPFSLDCESFLEAVLEEEICHSGDPILRQHVLNAKRHPTNWGAVSIRKVSRDSSRKIDAAVCAVLAFGARREYLNSKKVRTGHVAIIQ